MKTWKKICVLTALGTSTVISACTTTAQPVDERIIVCKEELTAAKLATANFEDLKAHNPQPGKIYLSKDLEDMLEIDRMESNINDDGLLIPRFYCKTKKLSFWKWLVKGDDPYDFAIMFIWFDKDGKVLQNPYKGLRIREAMPGEPVRFSGLAFNENPRQASLVIFSLKEKDKLAAEESQKEVGAQMERDNPSKEEPLKEVKIVK